MSEWIDVSRPVASETPVWPGDVAWRLEWTLTVAGGGGAEVGAVSGTTHAGTHVDAPRHLAPEGAAVDALPLDRFEGPALVVDASGGARPIGVAELEAAGAADAGRLLLATGCDWSAGFPRAWRALAPEAAAWCAARVRLVGTDAPSVDPPDSDALPAHRALLGAGVPIVEGLALAGVAPGRYAFVAFPLRWVGADASPVRAALRAIDAPPRTVPTEGP